MVPIKITEIWGPMIREERNSSMIQHLTGRKPHAQALCDVPEL